MPVKKIDTFKSGEFAFSRKYSLRELQSLRIEARILYDTIKDLPILPELSTSLEQELIRRSIHGTAALEGNPLTEERVSQIISNSKSIVGEERAEQEIINLKEAYDFIETLPGSKDFSEINEDLIRKIHKLVTFNIEDEYNNPGQYRNHIVKVGDKNHGGVYTPPKCLPDIKNLMKEFVVWINSPEVIELDQPIRTALAHYYIGLIHPFGNGNGRTARIIEVLMLKRSGIKYVPIMLSNFYYKNMDDYFWAFSKSIKSKENDVTPFIKFVLKGFVDSLNEIKQRIIYFIRKFALRDYYLFLKKKRHITQRQSDLLLLLLDKDLTFSLKDLLNEAPFEVLYRNVSERTGRRDLNKLSRSFSVLTVNENNKYTLNRRTLD